MSDHQHQYDFVNTIMLRCKVRECDRYLVLLDAQRRRSMLAVLAQRKELAPNGSAAREAAGKFDG